MNKPTINQLENDVDNITHVEYFETDRELFINVNDETDFKYIIKGVTKEDIIRCERGIDWEDIRDIASNYQQRDWAMNELVKEFDLVQDDYTCYAINNAKDWELNNHLNK